MGHDDSRAAWPLATRCGVRLLCWPRWDRTDSLRALAAAVEAIARTDEAALVLRFDPARDGDRDGALDALVAAFRERYGEDLDLEVLLEDHEVAPGDLARIGAAVDGLLDLGDRDRLELAPFARAPIEVPSGGSRADAVARWIVAQRSGGDLHPLVREALDSLGGARGLWLGGPGRGVATGVARELGAGARLAVVAPTSDARRARGELFADDASRAIDWYDLEGSELLGVWHAPLELLVIDASAGSTSARRNFEGWRQHLVPGAHVLLLGIAPNGAHWLEQEGLRLRSERDGAALLVAPLARTATGT